MTATGKDVLKIGEAHVREDYDLGVMVPKDDAGWRGPWDCAEFASWCVFQAAGVLYGCYDNQALPALADAYTGYWGRDAEIRGRKITVAAAASIPGAMVLRLGVKMGHIVISDGRGGTVEAHSTRLGVIRGTLSRRRWTMGILVPGIYYPDAGAPVATAEPYATIYRLVSPAMRSGAVSQIQKGLKRKGFDPGPADGVFGPRTHLAVIRFQESAGLLVDGEVGPRTMAALAVTLKEA